MARSPWIKHGFLNTLEHAITRGADALVSLLLLWTLSPEIFAKLASSQALIAPLLLLFVSPETVLYRDFALWKKDGPSQIADKLRAFRFFAWGKLIFSVLIAILVSLFSWNNGLERFWSLLWAFALVMGPQLSGPDREYLRLDLRLTVLNAISLYSKVSLLLGTLGVTWFFHGKLELLALSAIFSTLSTALISSWQVKKILASEGSDLSVSGELGFAGLSKILREALVRFSGWQHVNGIWVGWIQTMDLFFLTVLGTPGRAIGLYAAALKVANFSLLLPVALGNFFSIWVGRQEQGESNEFQQIRKYSLILFFVILIQGFFVYWIAPQAFLFLSHQRWTQDELSQMWHWMGFILAGAGIYALTLLASGWLMVRTNIAHLFFRVYLPWGLASLGLYFGAVYFNLLSDPFHGAAIANVYVSTVFLVLVGVQLWRRIK